jgi:OHCU decarboxylase
MSGRIKPSEMDRTSFVAAFGQVFEHSPWIAEEAYRRGLPTDVDSAAGVHRALTAVLREASAEQRRALIGAHPDLAGRLALAGRLTADSSKEQASAGLDRLTDQERARFTALNDAYQARFRFPFVMAVKGRSKEEIMAAFERRLQHDEASEERTALEQIERIALLRLEELLSP